MGFISKEEEQRQLDQVLEYIRKNEHCNAKSISEALGLSYEMSMRRAESLRMAGLVDYVYLEHWGKAWFVKEAD